jgi:hypothetical protein
MNLCKVTGTLLDSSGTPLEQALIYAVPAASPAITSTGVGIIPMPVKTFTTSSGYFELNLLQNVAFVVTINMLGFRQKVSVPATATVDLFSLGNILINNEVESYPPDQNW